MDPKDKKPPVASAVVIKHSEFPDLILHGKRKDTNEWSIPGGHVHKHESLKDAAVRETKEETGLELNPDDLEHIGSEHYNTEEDKNLIVHLFVCKKPYHHESMDFTGDKDEEFKELKFINPLEHDDLYRPNGENIVVTYLKGELKKPEVKKAELKNFEVYQFFHDVTDDLIKVEIKDKNNLQAAEATFKIDLGDIVVPEEVRVNDKHKTSDLAKEMYNYVNEVINLTKQELEKMSQPALRFKKPLVKAKKLKNKQFKRFYLNRKKDHSGNTGNGIVAVGVQFPGGKCIVNWMTDTPSFNFYDSLEDIKEVHGHDGDTEINFMDDLNKAEEMKKFENGIEKFNSRYKYFRKDPLRKLPFLFLNKRGSKK